MDYGYLLTLFLLINVCSFCSSKEEEIVLENRPEKIISDSLLLQTRKDILIALETYQKLGVWSSTGHNNGDIGDKNNWYYVRKGLWGEHTISLESYTKKGFFFRLSNSGINLEKYEDGAKFKEEASFIPAPGIEDYLLLSLRPLSSPKSYIRHYGGKISNLGHKFFDDYDRDVTWKVHIIKDSECLN